MIEYSQSKACGDDTMKRTMKWLALILLAAMVTGSALPARADHDHAWGGWQRDTTVAWSCTAGGREARVCGAEDCPDPYEYRDVPGSGHTWGDWSVIRLATCTQGGERTHACTVCGAAETQQTPDLGGHTWGGWTLQTAAGCTHTGTSKRLCTRCGLAEYQSIAALGHDWTHSVTAPGCTGVGVEEDVCSRCAQEQTRVFAALGHSWGPYEVTTPASCTEKGLAVSACLRCGAEKTKELAIIGHIYGDWADAVAATCTGRGTQMRACTMCGRQQTRRTKALGHVSDDVWIIAREPSLIQRGLQATACTVCGQQAKTRTFAPRGYCYDIPAQAFGPWAGQVSGTLSSVRERLIPIDMTADAAHSFPLVTEDGERVLLSIGLSANYYQGNENKAFYDSMVSPDGKSSYADLALQMAGEIINSWAVQ